MGKALESSCRRIVRVLDQEIGRMEKRLAMLIDKEAAWSEKKSLLKTAPDIGDTMVYTLLADLPELGSMSNKQAAALVGVAPMNRDSGKMNERQTANQGRSVWGQNDTLHGDSQCHLMHTSNQGILSTTGCSG